MKKRIHLTLRSKKIAIAIGAVITLYLAFGFMGAPFIVRRVMQKQVAGAINRQVSVGAVRVNPVTLSITLRDLDLRQPDGDPFVQLDEVFANVQVSSLFKRALVLKSFRLVKPDLHLVRIDDTRFNFSDIGKSTSPKPVAAKKATDAGEFRMKVMVDAIHLGQGVVHFRDLSTREPFATTVTDLEVEITNFGLNSDRSAVCRLALKTEAGESVVLDGSASFFPLEASGKIDVSAIKINRYTPYYRSFLPLLAMGGEISLGGDYRFRQTEKTPLLALDNVHCNLERLTVGTAEADKPILSLDRLSLTDTTADLSRRQATLGSLVISRPHLNCRRNPDNTLNLVNAFAPMGQTAGTDKGAVPAKNAPVPPPAAQKPFVVNAKTFKIDDGTVDFEDRAPQTPVKMRLAAITLNAADLSTALESTGKIDFSLGWIPEGRLQAAGDVTIRPLSLNLAVDMEKIDVRPLQAYLSEHAQVIVTQGFFNTHGQMALSTAHGRVPAITYQGNAGLNRFASVDRKNANDFLKWNALSVDKLDLGVNPTRLSIEQIALADFFARVIVDPDGSINLVNMFSQPEAEPATDSTPPQRAAPKPATSTVSTPDTQAPVIRIAKITLSNGDVDFSDRFIRPNYSARFNDLGGFVSGLESIAQKRADVRLEGVWAQHAPVKVNGRINPLIKNPYVDLKLDITDIELSPFSPYSGKYLGYILDKGKLTFNVSYLTENHQLQALSRISIDQLTLGETVASPHAVNLPIKLAVALLKDRDGNIELELPVSGDLDDPRFKIGKVVLTVLKNLIVKLVTAPFAALGALVGGGEELSYLDFEAGTSAVSAENAAKLEKLAKILYARPGLKLDVQGTVVPDWDREALRAVLLENRLKAEKLQRMMNAGQSAMPLETISLNDEEREEILKTVFAASRIAMPKDDSGKGIEPTPEVMEKLLRLNTEVSEDDFRKLANTRAFNAKNLLIENGKVERERIFIVEPSAKNGGRAIDRAVRSGIRFSMK